MALYKNHFYHGLIKKYNIVMGSLFDELDVVRFDPSGNEKERVAVPVTYANKEKWIQKIMADANMTDRQPAITLPRIAYEMSGLQFAPERKLSSKGYYAFPTTNNGTTQKYKVMQPVPYDFTYNFYAIAKTQEDMNQIVEQIVPFFTPDYTVEIRGIENPNVKFDIPITLIGVENDDNAQGGFEERRMVIWTFQFILKGFLFGPIRERSIIKEIDVKISDMDELQKAPALRNYIIDVGMVPYIDGVPLENIHVNDDWTIKITKEYPDG